MCCLFGLLDHENTFSEREKNKIIKILAKECEARGTDAAGIAYIQKGKVVIHKKPLPAHKINFKVPKDVNIIMGHTRLTTQGSEKYNENNHPFASKTFALAHNGVIRNDWELRRKNLLPKTKIETDSYIAVQLLEKEGTVCGDTIQRMAEALEGSFCFTILDRENTMYFVKGDNPLCIYACKDKGFMIYASTEEILKNALIKAGLLSKYQFQKIEISMGEILRIDKNGKTTKQTFDASNLEGLSCGFYRPYFREENTYMRLLTQYGKSKGVDQWEIQLLFECGYEFEEIEELLCDRTEWRTAVSEAVDHYFNEV